MSTITTLPPEVLSLIASHAAIHREKLAPYALVNKAWQAAFEKIVYSNLSVLSPSTKSKINVGQDLQYPKHGLTLDRLEAITSGPQSWRAARRRAIHHILYKVAVPHWLNDEREKDEGFSYDNIMRRENDLGFRKGLPPLFELISSWTLEHRSITLSIALQAENVYTSDQGGEPFTEAFSGFGHLVSPYRARLPADCHIPIVSCVTSLEFPEAWTPVDMGAENGISPAATLQISSACGGDNLHRAQIPGAYAIPSDEPASDVDKRNSAAANLHLLPQSVRILKMDWTPLGEYEIPLRTSIPRITHHPDALSAALRRVSLQLREIYTVDLNVLPEFFTLASQSSDSWPSLEILEFTLMHYNTPATPFGVDLIYEDETTSEVTVVNDYFDELYGGLGNAVQRMPNVKHILLSFGNEDDVLEVMIKDGKRRLAIESRNCYRPSFLVLQAWKASEDRQKTNKQGLLIVEYDTWPPI